MDLSSLAVSETAVLNLKHPVTGEDLGCSIELCGKDSDVYRKQYADQVKALTEAQVNGSDIDYAELDIVVYTACTVAWTDIELEGKALECTPENVRLVYSDQRFKWLHEQVTRFVGNRENFM